MKTSKMDQKSTKKDEKGIKTNKKHEKSIKTTKINSKKVYGEWIFADSFMIGSHETFFHMICMVNHGDQK